MKRSLPSTAFLLLLTSPAFAQITERISNPNPANQSQAVSVTPFFVGLAIWVMGTVLYFIPSVIASRRGVKNSTGIILLNLFLGWTGLGWIASLIWACSGETNAEAHSKQLDYQRLASALRSVPPPPPGITS